MNMNTRVDRLFDGRSDYDAYFVFQFFTVEYDGHLSSSYRD